MRELLRIPGFAVELRVWVVCVVVVAVAYVLLPFSLATVLATVATIGLFSWIGGWSARGLHDKAVPPVE